MKKVESDGKCPMTGHQCTCIPRTTGHWCCWSIPRTEMEAYRATLEIEQSDDSDDKK
jgi:hypothetical protein